MAEIVRSDNDLPTIRILLGRTANSRSEVIFETIRGPGAGFEVARCTTADLGLPEGPSPGLDVAAHCRLPDDVLARLRPAVDQLGVASAPPHNAIWLELPNPRGYLYLVPWERLLVPLGRPLLRLPYHTLRPQASANTLEIAVCASAPSAKTGFDTATVLAQMTEVWINYAGHDVTLHLFTDVAGYGRVLAETAHRGSAVIVHHPGAADQYEEPAASSRLSDATSVTSPWLRWIQEELSGRAVDVVHFVTHGFLSGDRGAIALASTPTLNVDTQLSRFVGSAEMSSFVSQVGAWGLVLGGPPTGNFSSVGLRELADASAILRPGATIVHELSLDPDASDFGQTVGMAFGGGPAVTQPIPSVTCWIHPGFVEYPPEQQEALHLTMSGHSSLIQHGTQNAMTQGDTPAWVAATTRFIETQQADWLPDILGEQVDPAAASALEAVSSLLERHVNRHLSGGGEIA